MKILLIRHGMTQGNKYKKYIGVTDEPLCREGIEELQEILMPYKPGRVFVSPLLRCRQTAQILFPGTEQELVPELAEMNFGIFENRAFEKDLEFSEEYRRWTDSNCEDQVPEGESKKDFSERCLKGFRRALESIGSEEPETIAFVVHGGTIMSVMEAFAGSERSYYEWYTGNGHGYEADWQDGRLVNIIKI